MEKNKQSFVIRQLIYTIVLTFSGAYLVYRGIVGGNFLIILGGIILFVIGIGTLQATVAVIKDKNILLDDELHAGFANIRSYVKETLLPLGFEEEDAVFGTAYRRGELFVELSKNMRDQEFWLQIASKSRSVISRKNNTTIDLPDFEISISFPLNNIEGFKNATYEKLSEWLKEQNIQ
jgi:hypothetical protein